MTSVILQPHTVLQGRYKIERLISQGGMGAVYEAEDQRLGHTVALKQILLNEPRMRKAFEREARLLAGLRHTALPAVSDHFTEDSGQFLVMQFIPGNDLGTILDRRADSFTSPDAIAQALQWADRLLDVLEYLHNHEPPIIHRDIKPQNLKLTPRGEIVLLDFGLAKGAVNQITSTTGRSLRAYTTQYAPLEQIQGTGTEPRSDLYALAATFYHVLTGEPPPNALTRAAAVLAGKPDPLLPAHKLNPNVPPPVAVILHQAMAHGIAKRFANAITMRTALRVSQQPGALYNSSSSLNSGGKQTIVVPTAPPVDVAMPRLQEPSLAAQTGRIAPDAETAPTLIVSETGQGHYRSISAAIDAARPGSRILVRPGHYRESLVIDRHIEISGDGTQADILLENTDEHGLLMRTDYAVVRGLTLRGCVGVGAEGAAQPAINIGQGRLSLENCDISTTSRVGVMIHGSATNPIIWRCKIHDCHGIGVLIYGRGRGTLEECDISNNTQAGVAIQHGGNPTIRRCKVYGGAQDGIYIDHKGLGTIEECDVYRNIRAGIEIKHGSNPFIRRCTISDQDQGYGIYIREKGGGIVEECEIDANARAGIAVTQESNPLVRRCKIHGSQQRGVFFGEESQGMLEQCDIFENTRIGVEIRQSSKPTLRQCNINRHSAVAVWVHQDGSGLVEWCDLTNNARGAWFIEEGCQVSQRGNKE